ncbi:SDR family NAD(P)-dependent oxidoreductase [Actinoplanes sp. NPDC049265]|uniref:SDR family NAD(P)-dependent oxidoreductase n=1 Tax=Actinoplanes sp. NPDC049265 TaxID=3363902 RepID=UPI00371B0FBC
MSTDLAGKVAIVTGGASGIGRETVKALVENGARVVVADLSEDGGRETVDYAGGAENATFIRTDVGDPDSVRNLVGRTVEIHGRLDIAHNNAGITFAGPLLADVTVEDFNRVIGVNLAGVFLSMRAEVPAMLAGGGGSIINTASGLGEVALAGQSAYVASKHGVIGLTKAAAMEYSVHGVRVNAVLPGVIRTPLIEAIDKEQPGFIEMLLREHPIGRLGTTRDIAEAVVWLASDAATFVTGSSVNVDGGYSAH